MEVHVLHALHDNFMYLIIDSASREAAAVDPADADAMVQAANRLDVRIKMVLTTHHHTDHAGGNQLMAKLLPGVAIIGGKIDAVQGKTRDVEDGDVLQIGSLRVTCLHTPAHTNGHISYFVTPPAADPSPPAVFTGDVLFVGGCGRFFEGRPEQMCLSMRKLGDLPPTTRVYCGHEYTRKNLEFCLEVEPHNPDTRTKMEWAHAQLSVGADTVPSTIASEREHNVFMRVGQPEVRAFCGTSDDVQTMAALRSAKDNFSGPTRPWMPVGGPESGR